MDQQDRDNTETLLYFEHVLKHSPENFYWLDCDSRVLGCNNNQIRFFGLECRSDLIGKNIYDISKILGWDKTIPEKVRKNDLQVIKGKYAIKAEEATIINGTPKHYLSFKNPLMNEDEEITGIFGLTVDITRKKQFSHSSTHQAIPKNIRCNLICNNYSPKENHNSIDLTKREHECLILLARGYTAKQMGKLLNISHRTIADHTASLREKFGCHSRMELIAAAIQSEFLENIKPVNKKQSDH